MAKVTIQALAGPKVRGTRTSGCSTEVRDGSPLRSRRISDCQCGNSASGCQDYRTNSNPGPAFLGLICAASARQIHSRTTAFTDCIPTLPTDLEKSPPSFSPSPSTPPLSVVHLRLKNLRISSLRPVLG